MNALTAEPTKSTNFDKFRHLGLLWCYDDKRINFHLRFCPTFSLDFTKLYGKKYLKSLKISTMQSGAYCLNVSPYMSSI